MIGDGPRQLLELIEESGARTYREFVTLCTEAMGNGARRYRKTPLKREEWAARSGG